MPWTSNKLHWRRFVVCIDRKLWYVSLNYLYPDSKGMLWHFFISQSSLCLQSETDNLRVALNVQIHLVSISPSNYTSQTVSFSTTRPLNSTKGLNNRVIMDEDGKSRRLMASFPGIKRVCGDRSQLDICGGWCGERENEYCISVDTDIKTACDIASYT